MVEIKGTVLDTDSRGLWHLVRYRGRLEVALGAGSDDFERLLMGQRFLSRAPSAVSGLAA